MAEVLQFWHISCRFDIENMEWALTWELLKLSNIYALKASTSYIYKTLSQCRSCSSWCYRFQISWDTEKSMKKNIFRKHNFVEEVTFKGYGMILEEVKISEVSKFLILPYTQSRKLGNIGKCSFTSNFDGCCNLSSETTKMNWDKNLRL